MFCTQNTDQVFFFYSSVSGNVCQLNTTCMHPTSFLAKPPQNLHFMTPNKFKWFLYVVICSIKQSFFHEISGMMCFFYLGQRSRYCVKVHGYFFTYFKDFWLEYLILIQISTNLWKTCLFMVYSFKWGGGDHPRTRGIWTPKKICIPCWHGTQKHCRVFLYSTHACIITNSVM